MSTYMQEEWKRQERTGKMTANEQKSSEEIRMSSGQQQAQNPETIWSATLRSMRIILQQYRYVFYFIILFSGFIVPLWNLIQIYSEISSDPIPWSIHTCGGSKTLLAIIAIFMAASSYNILSRNEISMYPGNVISRYGGTIFAYHILIVVSVLASMVGYLMQGILLTAASRIWNSALLGNAFSMSYLWRGAVRYLGLLLVIYAIEVLWFVLTERFHLILCYLALFLLAAVVIILAIRGDIDGPLQTVRDLMKGQGYSYGALITVLFGVWAILMLLSFCLAATVKVWKAADQKRMVFTVVLVYLAFIGGVWLYFDHGDGFDYSMDPTVFQKESQQQMEIVADVSDWEEKDPDLLSSYDMSVIYPENGESNTGYQRGVFAGVGCSASEAKRYGLSFDASKLDQDHVILLLGSRNLSFAGKDLGEDTLQAYRQSCKLVKNDVDETYQEENPEEEFEADYSYQTKISNASMILLNMWYGNLSMYMDDTTLYEEDYLEVYDNVTESLLRIVIYPDEWERERVQE